MAESENITNLDCGHLVTSGHSVAGAPLLFSALTRCLRQRIIWLMLKMPAISTTRKKPPQTFRFEAVIIDSYYRGTTQIDESSTFLMY